MTSISPTRLGILTFAAMLLCTPIASTAGALTDLLMSKVGVTQPQAAGGAGSIFQLAKAQMTPDKFQTLATAVPDISQLLAGAPAITAPTTAAPANAAAPATETVQSMLTGKAVKMLEASKLGGTLKSAQTLAPAFQALGMKSGMVAKFLPVVVEYVKSSGGKSAAKLLVGALSQ